MTKTVSVESFHSKDAAVRARVRAEQLQADGLLRDAAIYQINGLAHDPSNAVLLNEHVSVVIRLVEQCVGAGDIEEGAALLNELETRLSSLLERADPGGLDSVVNHLRLLNERRNILQPITSASPTRDFDPIDPKLSDALAVLSRNQWDWTIPQNEAVTAAKLAQVVALDDVVDEADEVVDPRVRARLREQIDSLRRAVSADELCNDAAEALKDPLEDCDIRISLALLQRAEASMRGFFPMLRTLDSQRRQRFLRQFDAIAKALDDKLTVQHSERSSARWQAFLSVSDSDFELAKQWKPATSTDTRSHCEQQLRRLQQLMENVGEVLRELDDSEVRKLAGAYLRELSELANFTTTAQREAYVAWALSRIQLCFDRGLTHIKKPFDDQKSMDETVVSFLEDINPSLLSAEASRAYTEVLEYFLSKLYAPGKENGFDKPGSRLRVLKRLAQSSKKLTLAAF